MESQPANFDDFSALAWVQDELRKTLDAAHKALRRTLKDSEAAAGSDLDDVEPTLLRTARQQLHQAVGVLELVGLPAGAALLRGSEAAVQRFVAKPGKLNLAAVETIERASFALHDFLTRALAGKPLSPIALFPQYRSVQELAGVERIHPADLWPQELEWHPLAAPSVAPRVADRQVMADFEGQVLASMRQGSEPVLRRLSDLSAGLAAGAGPSHTATLWQLAAGFFEAQALGLLKSDVYAKRISSRLLAQLRQQVKGDATAGERLARELLFFCTQARVPAPGQAPQLEAVRAAYPEAHAAAPIDYHEIQLGRYDPAWITQARKRVATAKDTWSAVAGGEMHRLSGLNEQFALVADSLKRLVPGGDVLGEALSRAVARSVQASAVPEPAMAMEVATSVLYIEAALEDGAFDHPEQAPRVRHLAQRVDAVRSGATPEPLEAWMEELYRRVSDRQTMGSVVQELRVALSESEKLIDQFFRTPGDPSLLVPVPAQLQAMRGVLSVLGLDKATQAVLRMRDDVDALVAAGDQARHQQPLFERLAGNLSALSFMIDLLGVQPQLVKSLFRFDAEAGLLTSRLGRPSSALQAAAAPRLEPELLVQAQNLAVAAAHPDTLLSDVSREIDRLALEPGVAAQPELAAGLTSARAALEHAEAADAGSAEQALAREQVTDVLTDFAATAADPVGMPAGPVTAPPVPTTLATPVVLDLESTPGGPGADDEMRGVFLEEAREVVDTAQAALADLQAAPDAVDLLTTVRRSFHTLKGSSRMVGLGEFGEAAWACEQLYNDVLARQQPASDDFLRVSGDLLDHLSNWVDAIAGQRDALWLSRPVREVADALRIDGRALEIEAPATAPAAPLASQPLPFALTLPAAADLDLDVPTIPVADTVDTGAAPGLDFVFDLGDGLLVSSPPAVPAEPPRRELPALNDALDPATTMAAVFDLTPTLTQHTGTGFPLDAEFTTLELDLPSIGDLDLDAASPAAASGLAEPVSEPSAAALPVIEPLQPSADVAAVLDVLSGFSPSVSAGQEEPDSDAAESSTVPFEPSELIVALEPSGPGALPPEAVGEPPISDQVKVVGSLQIGIPLFNIFLTEADELSRRLSVELSEWSHELQRPVGEPAVALAHSLGGSSATVGFIELSALARRLEQALAHSQRLGHGNEADAALFLEAADEVRRLLHQFAAGFLKSPDPDLLERLSAHELDVVRRLDEQAAAVITLDGFVPTGGDAWSEPAEASPAAEPADPPPPAEPPSLNTDFADLGVAEFRPFVSPITEPARPASALAFDSDEDIDSVDAVDPELFPIFEEEALELLPELASHLRDWSKQPDHTQHASASMRTLHTLKGGARLAGAMRLGELAHRLETAIEHLLADEAADAAGIELLLGRADGLSTTFEALRQSDAQAYGEKQSGFDRLAAMGEVPVLVQEVAPPFPSPAPLPALSQAPSIPQEFVDLAGEVGSIEAPSEPELQPEPQALAAPEPLLPDVAPPPAFDWSRFATDGAFPLAAVAPAERAPLASAAAVRVRTQLLDRMVNQAGEVSIARARLESEVGQIKGSLGDLTDNLERLRGQLRDIELQAETQMATRMEAAKAAAETFDPLEFDRFTRFQEITRMMAESVNDVATVQRTLQRTLETAEDELASQARLTRDLQQDLLRTRMVEFEGLSERLYRVVRQTAKETGKQVRLDIVGGSIEVDRGVLDRMTGAFEHLLRNCITHGVEPAAVRIAAGKDPIGSIVVALRQEGNEVSVEFRDDGAGLDLGRIRDKGVAMGLIEASAHTSDAELSNLIFMPGFSTADKITELSGRGVGMDVVRAEVNALGGRIETASAPGQGTSFRLVLPLTTAVTQVVMLRSGEFSVAVPATLVEIVRRATAAEVEIGYQTGAYAYGDQTVPLLWLGALLQVSARSTEPTTRSTPVIVVRSAQQRIALHVDEVLGNQEVVVKNLGPQLSSLPGLAGMTLLASGAVTLIYNPVALATVYGESARRAMAAARADLPAQPLQPMVQVMPTVPLVLVVDDSLTVRRVTQRLLVREGYRVALAKDGLEALERLSEERPTVVLSDIEMPRMDGFDLVRNIRGDAKLAALPVIMITSRIASKHREYATQLGVNHYLGKPYSEEELLSLIGRYCVQADAVI